MWLLKTFQKRIRKENFILKKFLKWIKVKLNYNISATKNWIFYILILIDNIVCILLVNATNYLKFGKPNIGFRIST